jgi:peptide/nickel transport system substrate-binding protein
VSTTSKPTTTTAIGNWWDSLGKPQYGGTMTISVPSDITIFDPYFNNSNMSVDSCWLEALFADDWTLDPKIFAYQITYRPSQYAKGQLAEKWEFSDPSTFVVHLRQNIYWQNIAPVNGRQFTASDVAYDYQRLYGLGSAMKGSPYQIGVGNWGNLMSADAVDKYTVAFKWKTSNPELVLETIQAATNASHIAAPEPTQLWGDVNDWHHAIGTGPFILTDFVSSSSATLSRNPNYWGYDERYPQNKLPYVDNLKFLIIPDQSTALAATRTGKIDGISGISLQQAKSLQKTNPDILQKEIPWVAGQTLDPRNDVKPFNDINVRKAMQMAIDLPTIAQNYYGGTALPYPCSMTSYYMTGVGFAYTEWPQDLKDQYAYNPTAAKQLLSQAGYPNGFNTNVVADNSGDMELLQIVKSYFAAVGINMDIKSLDVASWTAYVRTNHKHDQIVYCNTGSLGMTFEPLRQLNRYTTNYVVNWCFVNDPVFNSFITTAMADTNVADIMKVVRDANEYESRQHYVISLVQPNLFTLIQPWFKGYNGQFDSVNSSSNGPQKGFFYLSRFWVDQDLKKSME